MKKLLLSSTLILPLILSYQVHVEAAKSPKLAPKPNLVTQQFVLNDQTKQAIHAFLSGKTNKFDGPTQLIDTYIGQLSDDELLTLAEQNPHLPNILRQLGIVELADFINGSLVQTKTVKR